MTKLYVNVKSGNCYKVAWVLKLCKVPFELVPTAFTEDHGTKSPQFRRKNPNGQVPLLELDDGRFLSESNAIMLFLAETIGRNNTETAKLIPTTDYERGLMYQWLFFEQYTHEKAIAVRRAHVIFHHPTPKKIMDELLMKGYHSLDVMEEQLSKSPFMVAGVNYLTLADISLFAYTHLASEGEFELDRYPNIQSWMTRVKASSNFVTMGVAMNDQK